VTFYPRNASNASAVNKHIDPSVASPYSFNQVFQVSFNANIDSVAFALKFVFDFTYCRAILIHQDKRGTVLR
jgi:hypothetical protein